jgi:hypothetical protein
MLPDSSVAIADFKPDADCDASVIEAFAKTARAFQREATGLLPLRTRLRLNHPWFGPLGGRQWLTLAAAHHRIHRRQARKIVAMLGTT